MIIWYKNSFLASLVSIIGCGLVLIGIMGLIGDGAGSVLVSILSIVAGLPLIILGKRISVKKAEKKRNAAGAGAAAPRKPEKAAKPEAIKTAAKSVRPAASGAKSSWPAVIAGILFLLIPVCSTIRVVVFKKVDSYYGIEPIELLEYILYLLAAIAAFSVAKTKRATALCPISLLAICALVGYRIARYIIFYELPVAEYLFMNSRGVALAAASLLLAVISLSARRRGRLARYAWFLPALLLLIEVIAFGWRALLTPFYAIRSGDPMMMGAGADMLGELCFLTATFLWGLSFRRLGIVPEPAPQPVPQPEERPEPEPTPQPAAESDADLMKKLKAYQDLYDCGILSKEEYDQKIRELTRD